MFATVPAPIPARMKGVNRAEVCDVNFSEFVRQWIGHAAAQAGAGRRRSCRAARCTARGLPGAVRVAADHRATST